ncbi:MAG TPA: ATP-binding protein, partial [Kofleriaceae bacterium]|nr:ATP-binding protein [Kofleriaceae bacterium]
MSATISITKLRLLVAEDSEDDYELLLRELRKGGFEVTSVRVSNADALSRALDESWDLIVSDWTMPGFSGRAVLDILSARRVDSPCIVVSGTPGEEPAVEAVRAGALDFLSKDKPRRITPAVQRALREAADHRARLAVENELRLSEERYRMGFEVTPEPLLTLDLDRRTVIDANSKACEFFKCARDTLRRMPFEGLSPVVQPDGRDTFSAMSDHVGRAIVGESQAFAWTFLVEGELIPCEARIIHLPTTGSNLARLSIVDLRERIRNEEIRRRSVELELQNRRIQEANRLKSEFLANMSHELRTPLNAIIGFAELLHDGQVEPGTPTFQEFLSDILTSGRHLLQLINDVLDLAKVEAGKLEFRPEPVELGKLIGEVTAILRTLAAHKRLRIETEVDPRVANVVLDPARFKQVAYNYLSNALKFTQQGGKIVARVLPEDDDHFRFEVTDNGVGISAADQARLFVEFQQLESGAAKRHQGTGLGLALTRRLVEAQGGRIGVRSSLGAGSTFFAVLPQRASQTVEPPPTIPALGEGTRTILVVEDDARDQAQLVTTLTNAGYSVELAATGAEALTRWRSRAFDAVTIDLLL